MKRTLLMLTVVILALGSTGSLPSVPARADSIAAPVLKWQYGGCYSSWCETGWYSSPAVGDVDADGQPEVISSAYSIVSLEGATGTLEWRMASGHDRSQPGASNVGRTWPGIVLADVDADGSREIVTAHSGGWVSVYTGQGYFEPGWPRQPTTNELRGLLVSDLDGDGRLEIIVTATGNQVNTWVYEPDGSLRRGWPQLNSDGGYAWGVYNANAAAADLDGDDSGEIVVPSDVHYINAYNPDGSLVPANAMYGRKNWGQVGIWESLETELRGWGKCNGVRTESYRTNFADGPADIVDVNGDGILEVVVTGNVYDCFAGYPPSRYTGVYILNADRSRFNLGGFDWRTPPVDTGAPLQEDYNVIESAESNPVAADLDGDGNLEILFASYDGRVHAYWLDKTEHGSWPFPVYHPADGTLSFASEPTVADLDADGHAEVLFSSWTQKGSTKTGKLYILDYLGNLLQSADLPPALDGEDWNGALPAPTLADIDGDPDLELVVNTANSGVAAYDLPGTSHAVVYWGTGRGSTQRSGVILQGKLQVSVASSSPGPSAGEIFTCSVDLSALFSRLGNVSLSAVLPEGLVYAGGLEASSGTPQVSGQNITWTGAVGPSAPVLLSFQAQVIPSLTTPQVLSIPFSIQDGLGHTLQPFLRVIANALGVFLPMVGR